MCPNINHQALTSLVDELAADAAAREARTDTTADQLERLAALSLFHPAALTDVHDAEAPATDLVELVEDVAAGDLAPALVLAQHHAALTALRAAGAEALTTRIARSGDRVALGIAHPGQTLRATSVSGTSAISGELGPVHAPELIDTIVALAQRENGDVVVALVPRDAVGVTLADTPDLLGLRRSAPVGVRLAGALAEVEMRFIDDADDTGALAEAALALLTAAAAVGAARGSVEAAVRLTRERKIPRPVPGVAHATQDPLAQAVLGASLVPVDAARALVSEVAGEIDARLAGDDVDAPHLRLRALAALDVALAAALRQGEEVYEVVGTSGSGNKHGYDRLWRDLRTLSAQWATRPRRRELGRVLIEGAA